MHVALSVNHETFDVREVHVLQSQGKRGCMTALRPEVFIVDDEASVRVALQRLVSSAGHACRTFASAREFMDSQCYMQPGCLLLDVRLPDLNGLELQQRLRECGATTPVIFISGYNDVPVTVRAMRSGAIDFLSKPISDDALLNAIELAFAEEARSRAERDEVEELRRKYDLLTPREQDVFRLVLAGRLNKQIARELGISEKTVKVHRGRVMAKMGARRVAHLVQFAARLGYLATTTTGMSAASQPARPIMEASPVWRRKEELGVGMRLPPVSTGT